jgi:alpha-galactosidase
VDRDILYSLCQYGMGDVWKWGGKPPVTANCWRTTGDINDSWGSLHGIYESQNGHEVFAGPGHWNDPDMLVVGEVGWGTPHPSHLTPNEQILHISMWCLLSSPLLIGCDMSHMDPFTVDLLSNDEALDINQDPLGKPAGRISTVGDGGEVWARPLFDGTHAVGLVNGGSDPLTITADWAALGIKGSAPVRDLWLHKNLGSFSGHYGVSVPPHGIVLLKIGKPSSVR